MDRYPFEHIENFRDLAQYPCAYGEMKKGVIYRSGSPFHGTEKDLEVLRSHGIRTIIDLRGPVLRKENPHPLEGDPNIRVIPMDVPGGENFPATEDDVAPLYCSFLADPYFMRRFVWNVVSCEKPLLIHCEAGKDRTGTFCLFIEMANGVSREHLMHDYNLSYDGRLRETELRTIAWKPTLEDFVFHMNPATIGKLIDIFYERYGTLQQYFEAMGIPESTAEAFCNLFGVHEESAGATLFHGSKVLVEHMRLGHYSMPKGHLEEGETATEAALREIKEETGLDARLLEGFETHTFYSPKPGHLKRVTWFVGWVDSEDATPQPEEVERVLFLSPADAMRVLTYQDDRNVLQAACNIVFEDR